MDGNGHISVSVRGLLVAIAALLALVVAYLLGGGGGGTAAQAVDHVDDSGADATPHELTMTGTGKATAVPDQLSFSLRVTLTRADLDTALDDANQTMSTVLAALKKQGVEAADVQTTGLSMNAVYDYHSYSPPTLRGYHVGQRATVVIDDLADGGTAVSAAVAAGGNDVRVSNIKLLVGDTDKVMKQARQDAVAEAQAKAEEYAEASGQTLGDVITLKEVRSTVPATTPVPLARQAYDSAALSAVPIRAGKSKTSVTVKVVWELE